MKILKCYLCKLLCTVLMHVMQPSISGTEKKKLIYVNKEKISSKDYVFSISTDCFFSTVPGPLLKRAFFTL